MSALASAARMPLEELPHGIGIPRVVIDLRVQIYRLARIIGIFKEYDPGIEIRFVCRPEPSLSQACLREG